MNILPLETQERIARIKEKIARGRFSENIDPSGRQLVARTQSPGDYSRVAVDDNPIYPGVNDGPEPYTPKETQVEESPYLPSMPDKVSGYEEEKIKQEPVVSEEDDEAKRARKRKILGLILSGAGQGMTSAFGVQAGDPNYLQRGRDAGNRIAGAFGVGTSPTKKTEAVKYAVMRNHPGIENEEWFADASADDLIAAGLLNPSLEKRMALAGRGSREDRMDLEAERRSQMAMMNVADKYIKATKNERQILESINQLEGLLSKFKGEDFAFENYRGEDVPGSTFAGKKFASPFDSEAQQFRAQEQEIINTILNALSGAAVSDQERARIEKQLNQSITGTEADRMRAYGRLKDRMINIIKDREAAYDIELPDGRPIGEFRERGGKTAEDFRARETDDNSTSGLIQWLRNPKNRKDPRYGKVLAKAKKEGLI